MNAQYFSAFFLVFVLLSWPFVEDYFLKLLFRKYPELKDNLEPPDPLSFRALVLNSRWHIYRYELLKFAWGQSANSSGKIEVLYFIVCIRVYQILLAPSSIVIAVWVFWL